MGRYFNRFPTNLPPEQVNTIINDFYNINNFKPYNYKGEIWMKCGKGILTAPQIIRIIVQGNVITVEAFIRYAVLPGVYIGEFELDDSFFMCVPKKAFISKLKNLEMYLGFNPAFAYNQINANMPNVQTPVQNQQFNNMNYVPINNQANVKICPRCAKPSSLESEFCTNCGYKF